MNVFDLNQLNNDTHINNNNSYKNHKKTNSKVEK